jgi:DNA mismatch repair protein MutS2
LNEKAVISDTSLEQLEFPKLLRWAGEATHCPATLKEVLAIRPLNEAAEIRRRQGLVEEVRRLSAEGRPLRFIPFTDIRPLLEKVRPAGAVLEPLELTAFIPLLRLSHALYQQIEEADQVPLLKDLAGKLKGLPDLSAALEKTLDQEGHILDEASPLLADLRRQIRHLEAQIRRQLEEIIRRPQVALFLQDDFITQRSGRWVIPVRMDSKGQIPGVVHDVSRTGETAFVEPLPIIGPANELENLLAEEKAEVIRILRELSDRIRKRADDLDEELAVLIHLDMLQALALMADRLHMEPPQIVEENRIRLQNARHPLLALSFAKRREGKEVVPLTLELGGEDTVMVITGVNAGGKTIALKTAGLLLLMALSGLPVPADSSSTFPLVRDLLVDMGDDQSIESSLSTFSAHISRITRMLQEADSRTLILMDELGTGTDPSEGSAIACAVLQALKDKGAVVLATTHLTEIKGFVHRTQGMINASMEFDYRTLTPLYRLRVGEPGRSHALEIARQYGLPEPVLEKARQLLAGREEGFEKLLADLNQKRKEYEEKLQSLEVMKEQAAEEARRMARLVEETEARRKEALAAAYAEALEITARTKRQMNLFLEEMRKKEKAERKLLQKKLREEEADLAKRLEQIRGKGVQDLPLEALRPGNRVFIRSIHTPATVTEVLTQTNRVKVQAQGREIEVPAGDIAHLSEGQAAEKPAPPVPSRPRDVPPARLHLLGLRVDEALSLLDPFINHASLGGAAEVTIVHGVGTGILARAVRDFLKNHPLVKGYRKGDRSEGGEGVTVAFLD